MFSLVLQRKNGYNHGKRRLNHKMDMEKREEMIRRTVYVSDIDQLVQILALERILLFRCQYNVWHVYSFEVFWFFVVM